MIVAEIRRANNNFRYYAYYYPHNDRLSRAFFTIEDLLQEAYTYRTYSKAPEDEIIWQISIEELKSIHPELFL
jgi:hypothetical protein